MLVYLSVCMINLIFLLVGYFIGSRTLENKTREAFNSLKNKFIFFKPKIVCKFLEIRFLKIGKEIFLQDVLIVNLLNKE